MPSPQNQTLSPRIYTKQVAFLNRSPPQKSPPRIFQPGNLGKYTFRMIEEKPNYISQGFQKQKRIYPLLHEEGKENRGSYTP